MGDRKTRVHDSQTRGGRKTVGKNKDGITYIRFQKCFETYTSVGEVAYRSCPGGGQVNETNPKYKYTYTLNQNIKVDYLMYILSSNYFI